MTEQNAKKLAQEYILTKMIPLEDDAYSITRVEEFSEGWYVYYQSSKFLQTRDMGYSLVGNTPIFVSKDGLIVESRRNW
ncbi:hypothetical protein GCM10009007_21040 [Formosimonas limnophila]|uniref:Immunity protein 35 domain-containing protein n=1 Tax=Formosimonas limnophila TaxID=1384487 RepID=A0A8J3FZ95_9BURK|nr:YrhB domain-containing protein [Formosimonas limnophila]GHA79964.1 hypothetical protein GCM10009007_21040 [Formosimonas limnophila]